jgi:ParB family chromosome partitioning protein
MIEKENKSKYAMDFTLDDFFTTQEQRDEAKKEKVEELDISLLDPFPEHPFKVLENEELKKLQDSIKDNGILEPIIVRKKDDGRYEIVSGHRRKKACELNGLTKIPCLVRNMTDDDATIYMVDSNMHREVILPSEKAFAYKMKLEAIKHQGKRNDLTSAPVLRKLEARDVLADELGENRESIRRYIRLTELIPELLEYVDNSALGKDEEPCIGIRPAVELSYLTRDEQLMVLDNISYGGATPSHAQAIRMRKLSSIGKLDADTIDEIMEEIKANQIPTIKLSKERIRKVLPRSIDEDRMEDFIVKAIEYYSKHLRERSSRER